MNRFQHVLHLLLGGLIATLGLALAVLGGWLAMLGGSLFYLPSGIALCASGALVLRRQHAGAWLYAAVFVATVVWALWEVGLDGWKLMPRLFALAMFGLCIALLSAWSRGGGRARAGALSMAALYLLAIAGIIGSGVVTTRQRQVQYAQVAAPAATPAADDGADWSHYGRTPAGQRYSPLTQIGPDNVARLRQAWRFDTGDLPSRSEREAGREFNFEVTPTKVGDRLFLCTPHRQVIALDATTGRQLWRYRPDNRTSANEYLACRGVAYYRAPDEGVAKCRERILSTTADARLFALDAATGRPCEDFGEHGFVSLTDRMGKVPAGFHFITSQPLVVGERVVLGGWIYDNQATGEPSGVVRAYDPRSGRLAWAWDLGRPDPAAPLSPGEQYTRGTPNAWGTYTADPALGLLYLPLGNATPDYFGAQRRPFDDAYSDSIVALDIQSGRERWHFQTVHHDVWDYDLPVGPTLVDLPDGRGGQTPVLVQTTKMGELFLLDRRTGASLTPVHERAVPQHGAFPGERLSPTQPQVSGLPSLQPAPLEERDTWGATPLDQLLCRIQFRRARYDGPFTPPGLDTSLAYPAFDGVVDWYGASVDPERHLLIANASYIPFTVEGMRSGEALRKGLIRPWRGWDAKGPYPKPKDFSVGPQYGTPYTVVVKPWLGLLKAPCMAPPWGKLVAIDLATRRKVWERPLGTTRDMNLFYTHTNLPLPTGIFMMGASALTASGLAFAGATADDYLRAVDVRSGAELWKARLPAGGQATPMTYLGRDGRQYVVIAAGGHGGLRTRQGDSIIAFALPAADPAARQETASVVGCVSRADACAASPAAAVMPGVHSAGEEAHPP